jgi:hypothetical protein
MKKESKKGKTLNPEKYVDVKTLDYVTKGTEGSVEVDSTKINIETLTKALTSIIKDAERSNRGNKTAGRRFRLNTKAMDKIFLELRKITPRAEGSDEATQ